MKTIECKGNWTVEYAYDMLLQEAKRTDDVVTMKVANVIMRSDEPLSAFKIRLNKHLAEYQRRFIEKQKDPKVKLSVIRNVLDNCLTMGYINEYASHRIMELIKEKL